MIRGAGPRTWSPLPTPPREARHGTICWRGARFGCRLLAVCSFLVTVFIIGGSCRPEGTGLLGFNSASIASSPRMRWPHCRRGGAEEEGWYRWRGLQVRRPPVPRALPATTSPSLSVSSGLPGMGLPLEGRPPHPTLSPEGARELGVRLRLVRHSS